MKSSPRWRERVERGHPVRQRAQHALISRQLLSRMFALRAQADKDVRAPFNQRAPIKSDDSAIHRAVWVRTRLI